MASSSAAVGARAWIGFGEGGGGVELAGYALLSPPHFRLASRLVCCCLFIWGAGRGVGWWWGPRGRSGRLVGCGHGDRGQGGRHWGVGTA